MKWALAELAFLLVLIGLLALKRHIGIRTCRRLMDAGR